MKRFMIFAALAATLAISCTKSEMVQVANESRIGFQVANYAAATKAVSAFPTNDTFGAYAWTAGTTGQYFINNNEVKYDDVNDVWTTAVPYYWPKNQSVDFFCYYPFNDNGGVPEVSQNQIKYNNIDFGARANQVDFMYADKAVGFTDNANLIDDGVSARGGVPTLFRHAGAKVKVNVILGDNEKIETVTNTKTKWEVTLSEVIISGVYTKGSCTLDLSSTDNGVIQWTKPTDSEGYHVWTPVTTVTNDVDNTLFKDVRLHNLVKGEGQLVIPEFYALPQALVADQQKISLKVTIKAYRTQEGDATYPDYPTDPYLVQNDKVFSADLLIDSGNANTSVFAWEMNQAITYNITLGPAGQQITFDPAIEAWDPKTYATTIDISLGL